MANVSEEQVSSLLGDDKIGKLPRFFLRWYKLAYKPLMECYKEYIAFQT